MNFSDQIIRYQRIDQLIRMKSTGTPRQLALRLNISESNLLRIIRNLKNNGAPIIFDRDRRSYYYERPCRVEAKFEIHVDGD